MTAPKATPYTTPTPDTQASTRLIWGTVAALGALIGWASVARVDQVTHAQAQVIAAGRTQEIQSSDGGILAALKVKEGDQVQAGQVLAVLEPSRAHAAVDDTEAKVAALRITLARLQAEVYGRPLQFDRELAAYPDYLRNQRELYRQRRAAIEEDVASLRRMLALAREELAMNESLLASGDVSRAEVIRLRRQVAELEAQIVNRRNQYFKDAQTEMTRAQEELSSQTEQLRDRQQVLEHTTLVAPTPGLVKNIKVTTLGGVLRPAETLMEILPTSSDLIVEAKISPADIAFIQPGQQAHVKLDAYDYSIFGTMRGTVTYISPDTLTEETRNGTVAYYRVHVRIEGREFKGHHSQNMVVRPGMTAVVDIKALDRTVLSYLTKPITKTLHESLGER